MHCPGSAEQYTKVQECLDAFTEVEKLEADEGYNCQACKRRGVQATKKLTLYRCPPVLVIHLKRFSASSGMFGHFSAHSKVSILLQQLSLTQYP